jgi:hypothetical protein
MATLIGRGHDTATATNTGIDVSNGLGLPPASGINAIHIGNARPTRSLPANSIVLNATNQPVNALRLNGVYIAPIAKATEAIKVGTSEDPNPVSILTYNKQTKEILQNGVTIPAIYRDVVSLYADVESLADYDESSLVTLMNLSDQKAPTRDPSFSGITVFGGPVVFNNASIAGITADRIATSTSGGSVQQALDRIHPMLTYGGTNLTTFDQLLSAIQADLAIYVPPPPLPPPPPPPPLLSTPAYLSSGVKAPIFGTGAADWSDASNNAPTIAGYTLKVSSYQEDDPFSEIMQFNFSLYGLPGNSSTNKVWPGPNTYVVLGETGSNVWTPSSSNPPYPKFMFGAADNTWQRVWTKSHANYWRCRVEGNDGYGNKPLGSPTIVLEYTFFNSANYGGQMVCELLVGLHARTDSNSQFMVASNNAKLGVAILVPNNSYVFVGDSTGKIWSVYGSTYVTTPGY